MNFEQAIELIHPAKTIAVLAHICEDADAVGSSFALAAALKSLGKETVCYLSDTLEQRLAFMRGAYTTDISDAPGYDLCICLDTGSIDRLGERVAIFEGAKHTICIDHHCTNTGFAEVNCIDGAMSSTGELMMELFCQLGVEITEEIAENLYIAIASDTGGFQYSNTSAQTMRQTAQLLEIGIDHAALCRRLFDTNPMPVLRFQSWVIDHLQSHFGGKLCMICAQEADFQQFGVCQRDTGDIVNLARSVAGVEIAVSVRGVGDETKISFRSNGRYDVSKLALRFGGGGHTMAAGATVKEPVAQIAKKIIAACGEIIHD